MLTLAATYQQTKTIVNNVMSTYQTVLTVDPSVGQSGFAGLYNCAVENNRGTSEMTTIIPGNGKLISMHDEQI